MEKGKRWGTVLSAVICSAVMWYDYILLGSLAVTLGKLFFPSNYSHTALLSSFCAYAVGFCMRPVGASVLGHIGDRYGRRVALILSAVGLTVPMVVMSVAPTYESSGLLATVLLVLCILMSGFSMGGGSGSSATLLVELSKKNRAGFIGSLELMTAVLGSVFSIATIAVAKYFSGDAFIIWGWRIPFVVGSILGIASVCMRGLAGESPVYEKHKSEDRGVVEAPVRHLFRFYKKPLLTAICIGCIECCCFHTFLVFSSNYISSLPHYSELNTQAVGVVEFMSVLLSSGLTVAFGALSDIWGRKTVIGSASLFLLFASIPVFWLLSQASVPLIAVGYLIFSLPFTAALGPANAAMAELFPAKVRCAGFGLARNVSAALGGGLAPALCTLLMQLTGWTLAPGLYVMFWAMIGLIALSTIRKDDIYRDWVKDS